jgi:hypothetical protein
MNSNTIKKGPGVNVPSAGYPQTDINRDGIRVKGKFPPDVGTKTHMKTRGTGAATRGTKFRVQAPFK